MLLIQLMPLIQFNVYYTLHIKNNNRNNFPLNGFMLLIQFMFIINVTFTIL